MVPGRKYKEPDRRVQMLTYKMNKSEDLKYNIVDNTIFYN